MLAYWKIFSCYSSLFSFLSYVLAIIFSSCSIFRYLYKIFRYVYSYISILYSLYFLTLTLFFTREETWGRTLKEQNDSKLPGSSQGSKLECSHHTLGQRCHFPPLCSKLAAFKAVGPKGEGFQFHSPLSTVSEYKE